MNGWLNEINPIANTYVIVQGIRIIRRNLVVGEFVQFANHLHEQYKFVLVILQMYHDITIQQNLTSLDITHSIRQIQQNTETSTQMGKAFCTSTSRCNNNIE